MAIKANSKLTKSINVDNLLLGVDGEPIKKIEAKKDSKGLPIIDKDGRMELIEAGDRTFKDAILECVNKFYEGEKPTPEIMMERGEVISIIKKGGVVELTSKQCDTIKDLIAKGTINPNEYFQIYTELF